MGETVDKLPMPVVGDVIVYHDEKGVAHNALTTISWGQDVPDDVPQNMPCINLLYLESDEKRQDTHGRQHAHASSIPHKSMNGDVHGYYWRWPQEEPTPYREPSSR